MKQEYEEKIQKTAADVKRMLAQYLQTDGGAYDAVKKAMAYSANAGGKRIRPVLCTAFAELFGGSYEQALPLACAVEMVHTYSLIHDDLPCMDNDDCRRGRPSCHKQYGEATALLAGDGLLTLAFFVIAQSPEQTGADPVHCLRVCRELAQKAGMDGMIGGQVMDLANEHQSVTAEILTQTDALKTSALLEAACRMGAIVAGASEDDVHTAGEYAYHLGIAFQIVDDILDVTGKEEELGKPVGSDAASGKSTFVSLLTLDGARALAQKYTGRALAALKRLPDSGFLQALTEELLSRRK